MTADRIILNGKFLGQGPTGVHRVANELVRAIDLLPGSRPTIEALVPPADPLPAAAPSIAVRPVGRLRGVLWEQIDLPRAAHGAPILSLCNLAPMAPHNAVTMIHDAQVFTSPESYRASFRAWYRLNLRAAGARHRRILTVSHFSKQELIRFGVAPAERIAVIHNGVDHILRVAPDRDVVARLGLQPRRFVISFATTQKHKNVGLLLQTFARPDMAGLTLVLAGSADRAAFEALGMPVPDNVLFAGPVPDAALRGLMEAALCLAFPSRTEGFGLPPLEAMLLGCPAVIAPCGALPEICGAFAAAADPDDPAAWAAEIRKLHEDEAGWSARAEAGRRHAAGFTWARAARQLADILEDVVGAGAGSLTER